MIFINQPTYTIAILTLIPLLLVSFQPRNVFLLPGIYRHLRARERIYSALQLDALHLRNEPIRTRNRTILEIHF